MDNLTEFLLARIAEDESSLQGRIWPYGTYPDRFSPHRLLAECEAKRRIVEGDRYDATDDQLISRILAQVDADHPDYREEWRP